MRFVGIERPDGPGAEVATLSEDGATVAVVAPLREFWADPTGYLGRDRRVRKCRRRTCGSSRRCCPRPG